MIPHVSSNADAQANPSRPIAVATPAEVHEVFEDRLNRLVLAWQEHLLKGHDLDAAELCRDCPDLVEELRARIEQARRLKAMKSPGAGAATPKHGNTFVVPTTGNWQSSSAYEDSASAPPAADDAEMMPNSIGRYRIDKVLGEGGFGRVVLGFDQELKRPVAIKMPHRHRVQRPEDAEAYLQEARVVAGLDHPHIVPVYDVGRTDDGLCYVVSKFIEGSDLAAKISATRLSWPEAAVLVADVAEALHYAHKRRLVHRDVKPGNILIDRDGKPYLADFGLALKDQDYGKGAGFCGTPAYMSPEQANGEGHRVDGRSDIFSLGVVFYELLTERRPFVGDLQSILTQISTGEPRPPRQIDDTVPKELERICLKALAKRAADRYTTAKDMAEDIRCFLGHTPTELARAGILLDERPSQALTPDSRATPVAQPSSALAPPPSSSRSAQAIKIVPKGLRAFDARDADFFFELLPGARDRDGLPDSIRFWKTRIEEKDPDNTFAVGLMYGPSGCGKSSLVKAGLLPRLSEDVIVVYVEATASETETRLLNGLYKRCPELAEAAASVASPGALKETLAGVRQGRGIPPGKKVLLVLDQFEQWLHAWRDAPATDLVQCLRQCDGGRLQAIVMVRDDFWMAATASFCATSLP